MQLNYDFLPAQQACGNIPLIIIHGLFGSQSNWRSVARELSQTQDVYLPDCRNHGASPHAAGMSYEQMAHDIDDLQQSLSIEQWDVLGHSMGGKIAMRYAIDHTLSINRLIIADIAPKHYPPRHENIFLAIDLIESNRPASRKLADEQLQPIITDPATRLFLLTNLERQADKTFSWRFNTTAIREAYTAISANPLNENDQAVTIPALFIRGANSRYIKDTDLTTIKHYFPNSQLRTIQQAGHWLHAEQPATFLQLVRNFL